MESNNDDVKKDGPPPPDIKPGPPPPDIKSGPPPPDIKPGPPPPDIKKGPPPAPVPSAITEGKSESAADPVPSAGLKVKIKEDDGRADEGSEAGDDDRVGLGQRVGAFLIDVVVCVGISLVLARIIPFEFLDRIGDLVAIAYLLARDSLPFLQGQSLGKKVLGIRVEMRDGKSLSENWEAAVRRNAALIVPPFWAVELGILLSREDKPEAGARLGDDWAKTRVVKVAAPAAADEPE